MIRISHRDQLDDLLQKGRDLEKRGAVARRPLAMDHRVLTYGKKTVVFD